MRTQKIKHFIFLFLVCAIYNSFSQIATSQTVACVPATISFTAPAGATSYTWNFGNGSSVLQNPSNIYTTAGTTVVTVVTNIGTFSQTIVLHPPPTANFTFTVPTIKCAPQTVSFTNTSTGPASFTNCSWSFGDGGQNTSNCNPTYAYTLPGSYSITLQVTDANGCGANVVKGTVHVSAPPTVVISSNPLALTSCTAPFTAAFSGSNCVTGSPLGGGLSYNWSFQGGAPASSTQQTPGNVTFNTPGSYNVTLTVTDNNNCSATTIKPVTVSQPTLQTTIPATVCLNTPFSFSFQTNQSTTFWNFGAAPSPTVLFTGPGPITTSLFPGYTAPGIYTISVTAGSFPCTAVQTKTIYVEQVLANFTHSAPSLTCSPTFVASYSNTSSSNAISFTWTTNNGVSNVSSNLTNPTFTFTNGSLNPYTIFQPFIPTVVLTASSANGCIGTVSFAFDTIRRPTAWFNKDKKEGCAPLVVNFRDSSFTYNPTYAITSYTWNNGANPATIISGNIPPPMVNPTFTYSSPGTYTPYLIIQTAAGCIDTSFIDTVNVVNPPAFNVAISPTLVCASTAVTVNITPTSTNPVQHWHVNSDNGFFSHCINNPNPSWNFTHVGTHTFSIDGYSHSCKNTSVATQSVTVQGPIVSGRFETNCNPGTRKTVNFYSHLQAVTNATLSFGDNLQVIIPGAPVSHSVSHTYSASGNYTAMLIGANNITGCGNDTAIMELKIRDIQANFNLPAVGCASVSQTFDGSSSVDELIGCRRGYVWYFDNLPPNDTTAAIVTHTFTTPGTHTVFLMVKDENSCIDTTMHTMRISSAAPDFTFSANPICLSSGTVQMVNLTSQVPDPITSYTWDFGDGSPLSNQTAPSHTYLNATVPSQSFTVTLTATNSQGCTDTKPLVIQVNNPSAQLNPSSYVLCAPQTVTFTAPTGYTSYTFSYGSSPSASLATTSNTAAHTYTTGGSFTATLNIIDAGGCKSSGVVTMQAETTPTANFTFTNSNSTGGNNVCSGSPVTFVSTSSSPYSLTPTWNLNTGSPVIPSNTVVATYTNTGVIPITLTVTTPNGCLAVITKTISIFGVKADLNLDKYTVCLGGAINFNVKDTSTLYSWVWGFGDGDTMKLYAGSSPASISHSYTSYPQPNGQTVVSLVYYSSLHACRFATTQTIQVVKIDGDFNRNNEVSKKDSVHCIGLIDQFSNQTPNSGGYVFSWNFGDGGTASTQNPSYTYTNSGVYTVTLNITDPINNCKGLAIKNMTINALPNAIAFGRDTCAGMPFVLSSMVTANGPFTYTWSPTAGVNSINSASTIATATANTTYTLDVTDVNGCKNSTSHSVNIVQAPLSFQWDTAIVIGQIAYLNNYSGSNFSYTWSPPTDLSCINCSNPTSSSTVNVTYTVTITDNMGCFRIQNTHTVEILPKSSVDVPTAFTPDGDGTNDVIYVDGWGIKKLNYFRVFNRWGQLLFESTDIKIGWDGTFNGVPQNMETYVYQVSAETYIDKEALLTTGTFKLIR